MSSTSRDLRFSYDAFTSNPVVSGAREKAVGMAQSAREWLSPTIPDWRAPLSQLESLTTVMFNPLAAHPVYRSETMAKAMQLMQQQQQQSQRPNSSSISSGSSGKQIAWPSSAVLLQAEIPESSAPLSLFQGFSAAYPSFTHGTAKKQRHKRKKQSGTPKSSAQKAATSM
ncbi:hypothetical protein CLU79DRAFT_705454 [Phycomyces nitens]|nr:hypothetical protein CLU79DRAFT_705454 [Phycomyces nitens]